MIYGIICEFNPFHSGHKYLIDSIKEENDRIIAIMSGNFVQRGEFAIYDKFERAKNAIQNGVDLVIELPTPYSTLSAEGFAKSGVSLIESTGIANSIAFGAETDNIDELKKIAKKLNDTEIKDKILMEMKKGISYPSARQNIINSDLLKSPNNTLGIEYLRFTNLESKAIKRIGEGHDSGDKFYSASAIREEILKSSQNYCSMSNCEIAILAKLRTMTTEDFLNIEDVSDGLENRIVDAIKKSTSLNQCYDLIKTKRYTHSRIRRVILRSYLGITKDFNKPVPYIKVLAFNKNGQELLKEMKRTATLPIISKYSDSKQLDEYGKQLYDFECKATDLYSLGYKEPKPCGIEQKSQVFTALK